MTHASDDAPDRDVSKDGDKREGRESRNLLPQRGSKARVRVDSASLKGPSGDEWLMEMVGWLMLERQHRDIASLIRDDFTSS